MRGPRLVTARRRPALLTGTTRGSESEPVRHQHGLPDACHYPFRRPL